MKENVFECHSNSLKGKRNLKVAQEQAEIYVLNLGEWNP